jgi:hypothetical protein
VTAHGAAVDHVLERASQLMVGIVSARGPHVTPELFTVAAGRVWCLTAASSLKARALAKGGAVAVAASADGSSVVGVGRCVVLDAAHPLRNLRNLEASLTTPLAVGQYALDNAGELVGSVVDLFSGRLGGPVPPRRVVLGIDLVATAVLQDDVVVERTVWEGADGTGDPGVPPASDLDLLDDIPEGLRALAADGPAWVGWTTASGQPLVAPCRWEADASRVVLPGAVLDELGGARRSRACVTRETWTGLGPSGKQGVMLRGDGVATAAQGGAVLDIDVDGVTYWDGVQTGRATRDA